MFCDFSYSLARLRALGEGIGAISLSFHKEMAKERELRDTANRAHFGNNGGAEKGCENAR